MIPINIPYWLDLEYSQRTPLSKNIDTDVVIVGGGITGVSVAYHCAKSGLRTVLIEKNAIASGSAGRNGGMVVEGLEIDFNEIVDEIGLAEATQRWLNTVEARKYLSALIKEHEIDCDFSQPGSVYASIDEEGAAQLKIEAESRKAAGIECEIIPKGTQFKQSVLGDGLYNPADCLLNPAKLVRALAQAAEKYGALVYENTPVLEFGGNKAVTPSCTITAGKIVLAMESSNPRAINNQGANIIRSQAFVTNPIAKDKWEQNDWKIGGMLWSTGSNYISCRKVGDRIFSCKSIPVEATAQEMSENIQQQINILLSFFPNLNASDLEISHQWTGLMVETSGRYPYIREIDGVIEVGGHGGNGLTNGIMIGKFLAEQFGGKEIPDFYRW